MKITGDIRYVGVNDHEIDLFEGQYVVKNGMSYNSYVILDEKDGCNGYSGCAVYMRWLDHIEACLNPAPDISNHPAWEPDHSANIANFMDVYPKTKIVATAKAFAMMQQFFGTDFSDRQIIVGEGDTLSLGAYIDLCHGADGPLAK